MSQDDKNNELAVPPPLPGKPRSKALLWGLVVVLLAAGGGGAGWWYFHLRPLAASVQEYQEKFHNCIVTGDEKQAVQLLDDLARARALKDRACRDKLSGWFMEVVERRRLKIAEAMASNDLCGFQIRENGDTDLHVAAANGDAEMVKLLVRKANRALDARNVEGRMAIHVAAFFGNTKAVGALLDAGSPVDIADAGGNTPLHIAAGEGQLQTCQYLLDRGAKASLKNSKGSMPLDLAANDELKKLLSNRP
jgi:hypothetical protein